MTAVPSGRNREAGAEIQAGEGQGAPISRRPSVSDGVCPLAPQAVADSVQSYKIIIIVTARV